MTHRDGFPRLSARSAWRSDAGHRQGFPTPAAIYPTAGSPARPERRFPQILWTGAFGQRPAWLAMPSIAAPRAPNRKPWEAVSMGQ